MRRFRTPVLALLLGAVAGLLGVVAHGGFVDWPWTGLVLAAVVVTSGAWLVRGYGRGAWGLFWLAEAFVTTWLLFFPPANDWVVVSQVYSSIWVVLALVLPVAPDVVARRREDRAARSEQADA